MIAPKDLIALATSLPVIPEVITLLMNELNNEEPNFSKIEQLIYTDPVLTVKMLKLANSAQFNFSKKINNVGDALKYIGYKKVLDLIVIINISKAFNKAGNIDINRFWQYSLNVAKLTSHLAEKVKIDKQSAFTIGLIHGIGELIMHMGLTPEINEINKVIDPFVPDRAEAEINAFGFSYVDVGSIFAEKWKLSKFIVDTLKYQHIPIERRGMGPMAIILFLAVWRCRAKEAKYENIDLVDNFPNIISVLLNFDVDEVLQDNPIEWASSNEIALII